MARKCSHCGNHGHNSRTCSTYKGNTANVGGGASCGLRLFGVQLDAHSSSPTTYSSFAMKKTFSTDCFFSSSLASSSPSSSSSLSSSLVSVDDISKKTCLGYLSDNLLVSTQTHDRRKGMPWTEDEHKAFLIGLGAFGKGDWRGISRNFVTTRTPTQVASHAQKYFLRRASIAKKKQRRSSLFDMIGCGDQNTNLPQEHHSTTKASNEQNIIRPHDQQTNYDRSSPARFHHKTTPNWLFGFLNTSPKNQVPLHDLELKLGITVDLPNHLDQKNKPSSEPLLIGPISVI